MSFGVIRPGERFSATRCSDGAGASDTRCSTSNHDFAAQRKALHALRADAEKATPTTDLPATMSPTRVGKAFAPPAMPRDPVEKLLFNVLGMDAEI